MADKNFEKLTLPESAGERVDILLVDDRPDGLMALEAVLACPVYNIVKAVSGQRALEALSDHDFAVILLDVQMPDMDGFEAAHLIRLHASSREVPIIFITAINKDSHHIARGYESGAIDYLFKPIDPDILRSKVKIFVELHQTRRTLKRMNEELETRVQERTAELVQIDQELEQFAYVASHDLQEPLRKIVIFGERLREDYGRNLGETGKDYLERMCKASARMKTVIEELLVFSRLSSKEQTFEKVDLHEVLLGVLSDLEVRIKQENAKIEIGELPAFMANKSQIRHLFQNLVLNSLKFTKKGQSPSIVICGETKGGFAEIHVQDNGIGFDEKYLDRIFKLFQRLHSKQEYEGNGIGLSICQKITEQHGGKITAHSKPGEGATFTVSIPLDHELAHRMNGTEGVSVTQGEMIS